MKYPFLSSFMLGTCVSLVYSFKAAFPGCPFAQPYPYALQASLIRVHDFQEVRGFSWVSWKILTYIEEPPPFPDKQLSGESYQSFTNTALAYNAPFISARGPLSPFSSASVLDLSPSLPVICKSPREMTRSRSLWPR